LLVTASVVPSSPILVTVLKEALSSSETSILTKVNLLNIPEDGILHNHRRENLKSYISEIATDRKKRIQPSELNPSTSLIYTYL
jgi:hypothetical protein